MVVTVIVVRRMLQDIDVGVIERTLRSAHIVRVGRECRLWRYVVVVETHQKQHDHLHHCSGP